MKKLFIIFSTDLYDNLSDYLDNSVYDIVLVEEPIYFLGNKLRFNPLKPIYHRATMRYYFDYLVDRLKKTAHKIKYIELHDNWIEMIKQKKYDEIILFDPVDRRIEKKISDNLSEYTIINSPRFYLTLEELEEYSGPLRNQSFYAWMRKKKNILMKNNRPIGGKMSMDVENRKRPYKGIEKDVPDDLLFESDYIDDAVKYIVRTIPYDKLWNRCTKKQYTDARTLDDLGLRMLFPVTHRDSRKVLKDFIKNKLNLFGDYQDIILNTDHSILYHSGISPMLNIGLLTPEEVITVVIEYFDDLSEPNKKKQLHNVEGFIRQIIGWRELCRMMYELHYDEMTDCNMFNSMKKINKLWYSGSTGIEPVDRCIEKAHSTGYLHHIERLMIMGNIMLLCEFNPKHVYKWFMEFALDSYDWVMCYNVYVMATYSCGSTGWTTKPYISSSNYILRMSNYKQAEWCDEWDGLFWNFLKKHKNKIKKIQRLSMLLKHIDNHK